MLVLLIVSCFIQIGLSQFAFDVVLEAYRPKGLSMYIQDHPNIKEVAFKGRLNNGRMIILWATKKDANNRWSVRDKYRELKIGDEISYEVSVWRDDDDEEYTKRGTWTVLDLIPPDGKCLESQTFASGTDNTPCSGKLLFEDDFSNTNLNGSLWSVEQYIPQYSEDNYEFVSYENLNECKFISDSKLFLKPILRNAMELKGTLDLREGCTRSSPEGCYHKQVGAYIVPPIKSAKIVSKISFKYGKVEVKAKLPVGDWIYPQIELLPKQISKKYPKFVIAYARGNTNLVKGNGDDIGIQFLKGGYMTDYQGAQESDYLKKKHINSENMNVYSIVWTPKTLYVLFNNEVYVKKELKENLGEYRIALGVGVGGNFDFPDNTKSGNFQKPWLNNDVKQAKRFIDAKDQWFSTWHGNDVALQVDYVKVFAL